MSKYKMLKTVNLLSALTDAELKAFARNRKKVVAVPNEIIFEENDLGDSMYLLTSGRVQIYKYITEDQNETLAIIFEGDIFGEMSFIDGTPRSSTAMALDKCEMYIVKKDDFNELLENKPEVVLKICDKLNRILSNRLRLTNERVKESIQWNIQISGVSALGMQHLIKSKLEVNLELNNGKKLSGHLLFVANADTGWQITLRTQKGRLCIIPYNAVNYISIIEKDFEKSLKE